MHGHRSRILLLTWLVVAFCGCGTPASQPSSETSEAPTSLPTAGPSASEMTSGDASDELFAELPYRVALPAGWVGVPAADPQATIEEVARIDPETAEALQSLLDASSQAPIDFVAVSGSNPKVALTGVRADIGDLAPSTALELAELQNVDGIAQLPGIVEPPVADRLTLPAGETVRVRWQTHDSFGAGSGDIAAIGYAFVAGQTVYTFVVSAPPDTIGTLEPTVEAILGTFDIVAPVGASPAPASCVGLDAMRHDAPELESLLPAKVAGRALSAWSVRGRCWIELLSDRPAAEFEAAWVDNGGASAAALDLDRIEYAVAGRVDTENDPPYFVMALRVPGGTPEADLAATLFFRAAGFSAVPAIDGIGWEPVTLADRLVHRGTASMLTQSEHQLGLPYVLDAGDDLFLVITDQPGWAEEAVSLLPD